jgi:hypothetical protein
MKTQTRRGEHCGSWSPKQGVVVGFGPHHRQQEPIDLAEDFNVCEKDGRLDQTQHVGEFFTVLVQLRNDEQEERVAAR